MIGRRYSVAQRGTGTQGMDSRFRRNSLLTNTALILLGYIRGVLVVPRTCRKLLGAQSHRHRIPELVLSLPKSYRRITTKKQLDKIERNIKVMCQWGERCPCPGSSLSRELG